MLKLRCFRNDWETSPCQGYRRVTRLPTTSHRDGSGLGPQILSRNDCFLSFLVVPDCQISTCLLGHKVIPRGRSWLVTQESATPLASLTPPHEADSPLSTYCGGGGNPRHQTSTQPCISEMCLSQRLCFAIPPNPHIIAA